MGDGPKDTEGNNAITSEQLRSLIGDRTYTGGHLVSMERSTGFDPISVHGLLDDGGRKLHVWMVEDEHGSRHPVTSIDEGMMSRLINDYSRSIIEGKDIGSLKFRSFGRWKDVWTRELSRVGAGSRIYVVRDGEFLDIRCRGERYQYDLRYDLFPRMEGLTPYMISRLSNLGFNGVPSLLGVSFWELNDDLLQWSSLMRYPGIPVSGFTPFLSDLKELISGFRALTPEQALGYLFGLSTSLERSSFESAYRLGVSIGDLQGYMIGDEEETPKGGKHSFGNRILDRFRMGMFDTTDLGGNLGRAFSHIQGIKRSLRKNRGDGTVAGPYSGRKLKVLKGQGMVTKGLGPEEASLMLFYNYLVRKERSILSGIKGLRSFVGAPMISSCVDCSLERVSLLENDRFIFNDMDWEFHLDGEGPERKMIPLKYLAQAMNSLQKARYLSARRFFSEFSRTHGLEMQILDRLFLEYNLKKPGYVNMMGDLGIQRKIGKNVPFRVMFDVSIISILWYERCHNALVKGYNEGISRRGSSSLVEYPEGADTAEGIRVMQALLALSDLSRSLEKGEGTRASIESNLMVLLTRW